MRMPLLFFLLALSVTAFGQTPISHNHDSLDAMIAKRHKATTGTAAPAVPAFDPQAQYSITLNVTQWAQLLQLLDQSNGPHQEVKSVIAYLQENAKKVDHPTADPKK